MSNPFVTGRSDDSLLRSRKTKAAEEASDEAQFMWFSPPEEPDGKMRFLVTRDNPPELSILPTTEARFKKGLQAWGYESKETEDHGVYVVVKTRHNRIDLRRLEG